MVLTGKLSSLGVFGPQQCWALVITISLLVGGASAGYGQVPEPGSKRTILKDGVYAASFAELAVHNGTLFDVGTTTFGARAGWQVFRYPWVAGSIGFAAFGLGMDPLSTSEDLDRFRYNYEGIQSELYIMPDMRFYGALHYVGGNGRLNYNDKTVPGSKIESTFQSRDFGGALLFRAWRFITAVAGFGMRQVDPTRDLEKAPYNFEKTSFTYFYLGTRASIL